MYNQSCLHTSENTQLPGQEDSQRNSRNTGSFLCWLSLHLDPAGGHKNQIFSRVQGLFLCVCRRDTLPRAPDNLLLSHCVMLHSFNACVIRARLHVFLRPYASPSSGQTQHRC